MFAQAAGFDLDFRAQDFAFLPIDSWIESPQPRISKDRAVLAQGGDVEGLEVIFEPLADSKGCYDPGSSLRKRNDLQGKDGSTSVF